MCGGKRHSEAKGEEEERTKRRERGKGRELNSPPDSSHPTGSREGRRGKRGSERMSRAVPPPLSSEVSSRSSLPLRNGWGIG